jgi:uncharacterized protein (TIGR03083 family)
MPTILDKPATVELLTHEFGSIAEVCTGITADQWARPSCLPGWSVHDVLGHMVGTESMLSGVQTPTVDISHLHHMQNPIAEGNELWVESMRPLGGDELLARFRDVTGRRLAALEAMSQADFDAPSWTPVGRDETYGRFMRVRHYDCFLHEHDIRFALGRPPREDEADLRSALDEVATGIGYIVGRRAAMPEGSRVRIDLTGPASRTFLVQVDGRASVVDELEEEPTVAVELPVIRFLRLTGGRDDGDAGAPGPTHIAGDRALGEQLVANLAFTI